jgi:hypothetical protein
MCWIRFQGLKMFEVSRISRVISMGMRSNARKIIKSFSLAAGCQNPPNWDGNMAHAFTIAHALQIDIPASPATDSLLFMQVERFGGLHGVRSR